MNMDNYPNSAIAYDSYADLLAAKKDTATAIEYYQKAFAISRSTETKQKLNALQGKEVFTLTKEDLIKYSGEYSFETVPVTATILIKDAALWLSSPEQGNFELVPLAPDVFGLKNIKGYELHFEMSGDKPTGFTSIQPNGTFKAKLKP